MTGIWDLFKENWHFAFALFALVSHAAYLRKVPKYRYYASAFFEIDRATDPEKLQRWYRWDVAITGMFAVLLISTLIYEIVR
ncbi:hypothetical protein [Sphingorhabdus sp. YGSMI21]|uniref:hypothetical protein n=1 Tax=Sphingorhabdus sp. YGSMI21 TaxID=2077182 RepID=UPI000C1DD176|nr:hypothetical protein [Sphingorhabdus sp. YGSMI21]ATW04751.1 hypothetical protein CHN51_15295 [Sphingorhabdus sp. YGSMI21]